MPGTIDTLSIYQRLKSANLKEEAAREIADVFRDVIESNMATKTDIELIRAGIEYVKYNDNKQIVKLNFQGTLTVVLNI